MKRERSDQGDSTARSLEVVADRRESEVRGKERRGIKKKSERARSKGIRSTQRRVHLVAECIDFESATFKAAASSHSVPRSSSEREHGILSLPPSLSFFPSVSLSRLKIERRRSADHVLARVARRFLEVELNLNPARRGSLILFSRPASLSRIASPR